MKNRITESELVLPSLYLMNMNNGSITTSELIEKLRLIMKPSGEDLEMLSSRNDDKFSQKVRNLRAHDAFERTGYAKYSGALRNSAVTISPAGKKHLEDNHEILTYLLTNDFEYADVQKNLREIESSERKKLIFDENIVIQEGVKKVSQVKKYERSAKLRDYAISYFTKCGHISCDCCSFDFENFYGKDLGKGFIEIHHKKPVFKYEDIDIQQTLKDAIENLMPVCSNCHRMIHRNRQNPIEISYLTNQIELHGAF